jgi:Carboxypeptidase regulatory-like domain
MKSGRFAIFAAVFLVASFGATFGQSTNEGDISGSVTDTTGAAIPGATITVANIATGVSGSYTSNDAGVYDTGSIVAGNYKITYSKDGFTTLVHSSVTVNVGTLQLNAQLAVGTVNTQVVVNSDVPLLNTENGAVTATMSYETINQLPQVSSIGQNWSAFNILQPGEAGASGGNQGATGQELPMAPCSR